MFCPKCQVELAPQSKVCPLCGTTPVKSLHEKALKKTFSGGVSFTPDVRDADEREKISPAEFRKMVAELLTVSLGIVLAVTLLIDVFFLHGITWSRYTSIVLVMLWLSSIIPLKFWGHPWLIYSVLGPAALISVFLWFVFAGSIKWFITLGMPVALLTEAAVVLSGVLIAVQKRKGLNAIGVVLAVLGVYCAGIEVVISLFLQGSFSLSWSIVVMMSALPVAGFLFYIHYRITNRASLRKLFRL